MTQDLNALKEQYKKLGDEITKLEFQAKNIGLQRPTPGTKEGYYTLGAKYFNANSTHENAYEGFVSTKSTQMVAFVDAVNIMGELRCQPGIIVPNGQKPFFSIHFDVLTGALRSNAGQTSGFQLVGPVFNSSSAVVNAINKVGEKRIITAYKTLLFMNKASRGED
jgi:hypothetical protein